MKLINTNVSLELTFKEVAKLEDFFDVLKANKNVYIDGEIKDIFVAFPVIIALRDILRKVGEEHAA